MANAVKNCPKCGRISEPHPRNMSEYALFWRDGLCPRCKSRLIDIATPVISETAQQKPSQPAKVEKVEKEYCYRCYGSGVVPCNACGGCGEIDYSDTHRADCRNCNGVGDVDCPRCGGAGYEPS